MTTISDIFDKIIAIIEAEQKYEGSDFPVCNTIKYNIRKLQTEMQAEAVRGAQPSDLTRAAWNKRDNANDHPPERSLRIALDDVTSGKHTNVKHALIMIAHGDDGNYTFYQSGSLDIYGQIGLATMAVDVLTRNRE